MSTNRMMLTPTFFNEIRSILTDARQKAYASVNSAMVEAYWQIGQRIVEEEQKGNNRAKYGTFLIKELSRRLGEEFGKGFSVVSLKNFRKFYLTFPDFQKGHAARGLLSWTHYRLIMRVKSLKAHDYYIHEASEQGWSTRQLERNINSFYYGQLLKQPDRQDSSTDEEPVDIQLQKFLLGLDKGFAFVSRQFQT